MKDAIANAATKIGIAAATTIDCDSAANTPRKRKVRKRKKLVAPGFSPIAKYLFESALERDERGRDERDEREGTEVE